MQTERAKVTISVDAMGGDHGPAAVVEGCALSAAKNGEIAFILHGDEAVLKAAVARYPVLADITQIHHSPGVVQMGDKPSQVMRRGRETSMWSALTALRRPSRTSGGILRKYRRADGGVHAAPAQA